MAGYLRVRHSSGKTVYALIWRGESAEIIRRSPAIAAVSYNSANYADYAHATTEYGASGIYLLTISNDIADSGAYEVFYYEQVGASPAEGADTFIGYDRFFWYAPKNVIVGTVPEDHSNIKNAVWNAIKSDHRTSTTFGSVVNDLFDGLDGAEFNVNNVVGELGNLSDAAKAEINAECDIALSDYDPPTKAELDAGLSTLQSHGDVSWLTATGFSTHSAADVWSSTTRTLTVDVALTSAGIDEILDRTDGVESGFTLRESFRLILAASAGKLSGADSTTVTIRDINDSKDRITAIVDESGNRTSVVADAS